jgi:phosphatidylglycerophosphate synthase
MTRTGPLPQPLHLITQQPTPRFLGLSAAERNQRLAGRLTRADAPHDAALPTLTVPSAAIITPALLSSLPPPNGTWHLHWAPGRPPLVWQGSNASNGSEPLVGRVPDGAVLDISTRTARRRAAWRLLRASGKPTDGWLSRHIHRKISRLFSYVFLQMGLSANAATLFTFLVGALTGWLMAQTTRSTMIAGAALFWFASVADGIDGEMARLTYSDSHRGEQIDTFVDAATYIVAFAGVTVGWWRQGMGRDGLALAVVVAVGLPAIFLWAMQFVREATGGRVDLKAIEYGVVGAARATGAPALRIASIVFVLFRREAVALAFLLVSFVTVQRVVYPALIASALLIIVATIVGYHGQIDRAIRLRVNRPAA